jgi:hypothetical protein
VPFDGRMEQRFAAPPSAIAGQSKRAGKRTEYRQFGKTRLGATADKAMTTGSPKLDEAVG